MVPQLSQIAQETLKGEGLPATLKEAFLQAMNNPEVSMSVAAILLPASPTHTEEDVEECRRVV